MKITVLAENTALSDAFGCEHGLSLYIEANGKKLLFDMGGGGLFHKNAEKLGVGLAETDMAFVSHGHYDHGGGLAAFLSLNTKAPVYIRERAFGGHCARRPNGEVEYVGLDPALRKNDRLVFTGDYLLVDENLELFSRVEGRELWSHANDSLLTEGADGPVPDDFGHEQDLIVTEGKKTLLVAGCAHNGIVNILERFRVLKGRWPDFVIGGFHLYNPGSGKPEPAELIERIGRRLNDTGARFYTCHCTGAEAYAQLRAVMGENIEYISAGKVFEL